MSDYDDQLEKDFLNSPGSFAEKMEAFPRFVPRQIQTSYLYRWEIFKESLGIHGSVVELGVWMGFGVFSFANFSSILEPYNHTRRVIGFDTFTGFPSTHPIDKATERHADNIEEGGFFVDQNQRQVLENAINNFDKNRTIPSIPKIELVAGDVTKSMDNFLEKNPHLLISLLYVDFDLYEPCKYALEKLLPRIPRGGIIAFDELHYDRYPGETIAFLETNCLSLGPLKRMPFEPLRSYIVKE